MLSTAGPAGTVFKFRMTPGDPDPDVEIMGTPDVVPQSTDALGWRATVSLSPGLARFEATASQIANGVVLHSLHRQFAVAFSTSDQFHLAMLNRSFSIPIVGADKAIAALHHCLDLKLREWGVDARAFDGLRKPPTDIAGYLWISAKDYPSDASRQAFSGQVIARLGVNSAGRVTNCKVVVPSGRLSMDQITCRRALERGRFNPAIGADGKPTAAQRVVDVEFRIYG